MKVDNLKQNRIGVDVDGVLADFNRHFIELVIKLTGKDFFPARPFDIPCWSYPEYYGYTAEDNSKVWEWIELSRFFWQGLDAYKDTPEMLAQLYGRELNGDYVYFITSRPGKYAKQQTEDWLRRWLGPFNAMNTTVLITSDKCGAAETLNLTHYIDDKTENCMQVMGGTQTKTYVLNQPWNGNCLHESIKRVNSPLDMLRDL